MGEGGPRRRRPRTFKHPQWVEPALPRKASPTGRRSRRSSAWNRAKPLFRGASFSERECKFSPSRRPALGMPRSRPVASPGDIAHLMWTGPRIRHEYPRHSKSLRPSLPPALSDSRPRHDEKTQDQGPQGFGQAGSARLEHQRRRRDLGPAMARSHGDCRISRRWSRISALTASFASARAPAAPMKSKSAISRVATNSCGCIDHRVNGLGTCKHIEGVLSALKTKHGRAAPSPPPRNRLAARRSVPAARRRGEAKARRRGAHRRGAGLSEALPWQEGRVDRRPRGDGAPDRSGAGRAGELEDLAPFRPLDRAPAPPFGARKGAGGIFGRGRERTRRASTW